MFEHSQLIYLQHIIVQIKHFMYILHLSEAIEILSYTIFFKKAGQFANEAKGRKPF